MKRLFVILFASILLLAVISPSLQTTGAGDAFILGLLFVYILMTRTGIHTTLTGIGIRRRRQTGAM